MYTIKYIVNVTATHLPMPPGESATHIPIAIGKGMQRFKDFLDIQIVNGPGGYVFTGGDLTSKNAWAIFRKPYTVILNTQVQRWGKTWSLFGVEIVAPHEVGHGVVSYNHLDYLPDYYGSSRFSHVMKGGASTYMYYPGAFSPAEIQIMLQKGHKLNAKPIHPYALVHKQNLRAWNTRRKELRAAIPLATGDEKIRLQQELESINVQVNADVDLTKKIVLLYPYHYKMFPWQSESAVKEARAISNAVEVEKIYSEAVKESESSLQHCIL